MKIFIFNDYLHKEFSSIKINFISLEKVAKIVKKYTFILLYGYDNGVDNN